MCWCGLHVCWCDLEMCWCSWLFLKWNNNLRQSGNIQCSWGFMLIITRSTRSIWWYLKFDCLQAAVHTYHHLAQWWVEQLLTQHNFHASSQNNISGLTNFSCCRHHLTCPLAWSYTTRLFPLELHQKQGIQNMSCQYWWMKTANLGGYLRGP
jgi:hypothetical protein